MKHLFHVKNYSGKASRDSGYFIFISFFYQNLISIIGYFQDVVCLKLCNRTCTGLAFFFQLNCSLCCTGCIEKEKNSFDPLIFQIIVSDGKPDREYYFTFFLSSEVEESCYDFEYHVLSARNTIEVTLSTSPFWWTLSTVNMYMWFPGSFWWYCFPT